MAGIILLTCTPPTSSQDDSEINVQVMIDFGNGVVEWTSVGLDTNLTAIKATEEACAQLDLTITTSWSMWGAFVSEIGDISPSDYSWWWGIFIWNNSQETWESSSVGASSIELNDGDIIGWYPAWDFISPAKPIATPSMRYPWAGFQGDALNLGAKGRPGPQTNSVSWVFDTGTRELAASPAMADQKIVVNNWGGTFCLDEEGNLLWKNEEVIGVFSPAFGHDKVLVGGKDGYLYALNITNGEILWSTEITSHPGLSGVVSSPTLVKGRIYLGSYNSSGGFGSLFCLNENSGEIVWESPTSSSVYFSSPAVHKDKVYIGTMGLYNSSTLQWKEPYGMYSFDANSGEMIWYYSVNGSVGSSPTIVDDKVLFSSKDGYLYKLDAQNGDLVWKKNIGSSVSSPAIWNEKIFVGSGEMNGPGKFYCLDMEGDILWEYIPNGAVQSSPAIAGDNVYFATNVQNGTIYCLDLESGQLVWDFIPTPNQFIISSPAVVNDKLYIASDNGRLYCFGGDRMNITVGDASNVVNLYAGEDVQFYHKSTVNSLNIKSIDSNIVTLKIGSMEESAEVEVGGVRNLDTDGNGVNDLRIGASSVNTSSQSATLTFTTLYESEDSGSDDIPVWAMSIFIIVIILIVIGIANNLKHRS